MVEGEVTMLQLILIIIIKDMLNPPVIIIFYDIVNTVHLDILNFASDYQESLREEE
jgi:hypothetical protein